MPTQQEIKDEQAKEALYNQIAETIISKTAWGKYYKYMKLASQMGQGMLPHKICTDSNGRTVTMYQGDFAKVVGSFLKPAHEQASRDLSQQKYGRAIVDLLGFGSQLDIADQNKMVCTTYFKPDEILKVTRLLTEINVKNGKIRIADTTNQTQNFIKYTVLGLTGAILLSKLTKK